MEKVALNDSTKGIHSYLNKRKHRIDSALMRQALYTTTRLGIYFSLSDYLKYTINGGENLSGF
jgi:hypothetical protein